MQNNAFLPAHHEILPSERGSPALREENLERAAYLGYEYGPIRCRVSYLGVLFTHVCEELAHPRQGPLTPRALRLPGLRAENWTCRDFHEIDEGHHALGGSQRWMVQTMYYISPRGSGYFRRVVLNLLSLTVRRLFEKTVIRYAVVRRCRPVWSGHCT